jgi:hypothetical protein
MIKKSIVTLLTSAKLSYGHSTGALKTKRLL